MARVLDLTPQALADLRVPLILSAVALAGAFLLGWVLRERGRGVASAAAIALGMVGLFLASNLSYRALEPSLSSRALATSSMNACGRAIVSRSMATSASPPASRSIATAACSSTTRPAATSEFGSHYPDAPKTFFSDTDFLELWNGKDRVLLVVPEDRDAEVLQKLPRGATQVLASAGGKTVYVNRAD